MSHSLCNLLVCLCLWPIFMNGVDLHEHIRERAGSPAAALLTTYNLPASEMSALYDLYTATDGPKWIYHGTRFGKPWNFSAPNANPCTQHWQGLACVLVPPNYHIHSIALPQFNMQGTLPDTLSALTKMIYFSVLLNYLTGTLPSSLGYATSLQLLNVKSNFFTGTIPGSLGNLLQLQSLDVSLNQLRGSLPDSLADLTLLLAADFGANHLTGSIPCWLGNFTNLGGLHLYRNQLTGPVPECICHFVNLSVFDIANNQLTGTFPNAVGGMVRIDSLYVHDNKMTGTLPASIGQLARLVNLEVYGNAFTGTIPPSFGRLGALNVFALQSNKLTGSLPASLCNLSALNYMYLSDNRLTGTIPPGFHNLTRLKLLEADSNHLAGTIPYYLCNFTALEYLVLHDNAFSGPLPRSLANMTQLQELQVQNNRLSGSLDGLFSPHTQRFLAVIQVENNQLTGELPAEAFALPSLLTFAAVSNCFHGTLPVQVCNSSKLEVLVLDGVSSAKACRSALLPGLSSSYSTTRTLYGSVPACLFQLPVLTTLHLSGNGFTGQIPDVVPSASLIDLTLSHNLLTGSIPGAFQRRQWLELDLSYNRLSGTLLHSFASEPLNFTALAARERDRGINANASQLEDTPALSLESNHLSGRLPSSILQVKNISVLGTNVFSCNLDRSDLPQHDGERDNYQCGSDSFDVPYYLWLGLAGVLAAAAATVAALGSGGTQQQWLGGLRARVQRWTAAEDNSSRTGAYLAKLRSLAHVAAAVMAFSLLVLLPLYLVLNRHYGTVTHAYAWMVSAAYLSGIMPAAWEFTIWTALMGGFLVVFLRCTYDERSAEKVQAPEARQPAGLSSWAALQSTAVYVSFVTINLVVVFGVNAAFVYVAIYRSSALLVGAQVLVSLFKIAWNNNCSTLILRALVRWVYRADCGRSLSDFASLQVFVALLNNIVIPCMVVAVVSPDCFYVVFDAAPAVTSRFSYRICTIDDNFVCLSYSYAESSTSYNPPFRYSYQCSSSFITYYAPAYVILCLVLTFGYPALQLGVLLWYQSLLPGSRTHNALGMLLPGMLKPVAPTVEDEKRQQPGSPAGSNRVGANRMLTVVLTFLGLLLTFGVAFPPLAVALAATAAVSAYGTALKVDRLLFLATAAGRADIAREVETECARAGSAHVLRNAAWMLLSTCSLFYTLFLFDTLGSAVGFAGAQWVLVAMPMMPLVLYVSHAFYCAHYQRASSAEAEQPAKEADVELSIIDGKKTETEGEVRNVLQR